jgi:hypothetical protein
LSIIKKCQDENEVDPRKNAAPVKKHLLPTNHSTQKSKMKQNKSSTYGRRRTEVDGSYKNTNAAVVDIDVTDIITHRLETLVWIDGSMKNG